MRGALIFAAVLFGLPLLFLGWLVLTDGKVVFVQNPNQNPVSIQIATQNDSYSEMTDPRAVSANAWTWVVFDPQIRGDSGLLCTGMRGVTRIALATVAHPMPMFSKVTLDSCEGSYVFRTLRTPPRRTAGPHRITPPQPLN